MAAWADVPRAPVRSGLGEIRGLIFFDAMAARSHTDRKIIRNRRNDRSARPPGAFYRRGGKARNNPEALAEVMLGSGQTTFYAASKFESAWLIGPTRKANA
jgi:hypothetical protein